MSDERQGATLHDLITNPPGSRSAHVASRRLIRDALEAKYREATADQAARKRFRTAVSRGKSGAFLVWVKVPSTSVQGIDYDVVLELSFDEGKSATAGAWTRAYTNAPSWLFTQAHAWLTAGLLIPGWEKAIGRAAKDIPQQTNPMLDIGFDVVLFKAIAWMLGPAGLRSRHDLERAAAAPGHPQRVPSPSDKQLWAETKLAERERASKLAPSKVPTRKKEAPVKEEPPVGTRARPHKSGQTAKAAKQAKATSRVASAGSRGAKRTPARSYTGE